MQIIDKLLKDLIAYTNNARKNDPAVADVAESIRRYGFKVPCVIGPDNVIICGHTRVKAAKALGLKTVPCVVADDLTPEQIREFRLVDNKVAEVSKWDKDKLAAELVDIDFGDLQLDWGVDPAASDADNDQEGYYGDERERTGAAYNLHSFDPARAAGQYELPTLRGCAFVPKELIGFNYVLSTKKRRAGVHFFIDDYQFERMWSQPELYIEKLKEFDCVLTPDFSLYVDMPMAMKIWNVYRSRLIGQMCQDAGMRVIPTITWAQPETYAFCFDGLPQGGTVALSTVGVMTDDKAKQVWMNGAAEMMRQLHPKTILLYGSQIDFDFGGAKIVCFDNKAFRR